MRILSKFRAEPKPKEKSPARIVPFGVVTDLELFEVANQAGIDIENDIHYFMVIEDVI